MIQHGTIKSFYEKYRHGIPLLIYGIFYLTWFAHLENRPLRQYHIIHMAADDYIPFCEVFVIPYFLWFAYVAFTLLYFLGKEKNSYYRMCAFLFTGMTLFLIVSAVYPNGHLLRPTVFPRDNAFTRLIGFLYAADTPTNLFPSIHVYNSLGAHFAVANSPRLAEKKWLRAGSFALSLSIIMSTVFIKQHSLFDMLTAFALAAVMYGVIYLPALFGKSVKLEKPAADFISLH